MTVAQLTDNLLGAEGGFTNQPGDPGGPTNWGITLAEWERYLGYPLSAADVEATTRDQARGYYAWWLGQHGLLQLTNEAVQVFMVNFALNSGVDRAVRGLQDAAGVQQDGHLGPITLAAANGYDQKALLKHLVLDRMRHLIRTSMMQIPKDLIEKTLLQDLEGWWNRVWREGVLPL